ncbi:MAG TPA: hypothetical protein VFF14_01390 [Candidatus Deferrimicrobium sp.]|nr:hypothetical protein [Candidatus Deferrimicrobium sp.]
MYSVKQEMSSEELENLLRQEVNSTVDLITEKVKLDMLTELDVAPVPVEFIREKINYRVLGYLLSVLNILGNGDSIVQDMVRELKEEIRQWR